MTAVNTAQELGPFSLSLAVEDLTASRAFYEALGFEAAPPSGEDGVWESYGETWLMLFHRRGEPGEIKLGLFQGMFDANTLTFNPPDVRAVQEQVKKAGVGLVMEADGDEGPGAAMLLDPDGNPVLLEQY